MKTQLLSTFIFFITMFVTSVGQSFAHQNVLLIIADDLGVDVLEIDHASNTVQVTTELPAGAQQVFDLPNVSTLLANGVYFTNTWATPICSPTRATIYTGLQPWRTGVGWATGNYVLADQLPDGMTDVKTIANAVCDNTETRTCGLFGKWHLGGDTNAMGDIANTPLARGWDYYAGNLGSHFEDGDEYSSWTKYTSNATKSGYIVQEGTNRITTYATQDVVDEAKTWIASQTGTWFATLAFNAPHSPFHVPPNIATFDSSTDTSDSKGQYNAMDQSLDTYLGKLWDADYVADITDQLRNTLIIFLGDNGTPGNVANVDREKAKKSVYLGGIHVPLIIADGAKVVDSTVAPTYLASSVIGRTQRNQVNVADLFKTILKRTGGSVPAGFGLDSYDLSGYLQDRRPSMQRMYNFTQQYTSGGNADATISNGIFKLNYLDSADWELFNIVDDPTESTNLYGMAAYIGPQVELMGEIVQRQPTSDPAILW